MAGMAGSILDNYVPIAVFLIFGFLVPIGALVFVKLVGPRRPSAAKCSTYECGWIPYGTARVRFNIEYYLYAIVFLVFDVEVLFLYPWAVSYRNPLITVPGFTTIAAIELLIFVLVLIVGYVYAWKKGALEWIR
ncbi:MAG: dehydrogenase subunit [Methanosarcinales archaeon]|nr:MAG: F420H2 dehydrogenase subunit [Euryarchaeota archaeon 55_53]KUK30025.1 MAG: F420H2 dehydrogenase [Methanosarcinales archeaon 56_1174]MDI3488704.1 dehydrogenase subunit [Methanosarcinales archaeon]MDN5294916.1 dehydrogenase subunit [Methanosarcinales archaeon]